MQLLVTRMLTTLSLLTLLILAAVSVRLHGWSTEKTLVQWPATLEFFNVLEMAPAQVAADPNLEEEFVAYSLPELTLEAPIRKIAAVRKPLSVPRVEFQRVQKEINILDEAFSPIEEFEPAAGEWRELQGSTTVPEFDSIKLEAISVAPIEATNLLALAEQYSLPQETMLADVKEEMKEAAPEQVIEDAVKTAQAAPAVDAEPEFFAYEAKPVESVSAKSANIVTSHEYSLPGDISVSEAPEATTQKALPQTEDEELVTFTYTGDQPAKQLDRPSPTIAGASNGKPVVPSPAPSPVPPPKPDPAPGFVSSQVVIAPLSVSTQVTSLRHFEMRAQDDGNTILQDNGSGEISIQEMQASQSGSRSFVLLQRDHVPTHIDVPFAAGVKLEIPTMERSYFAQFEKQPGQTPVGYVLIELDDETESVMVDGAKPRETRLTDKFIKTTDTDYRYVMLSGVEVGNRLLTAVRTDGKKSQRIIHVHEEEITFDANLYTESGDLTISLSEEGMLSRSRRDLVVSGEQVAMTFGGQKSQKISPAAYKLRAAPLLLGSRHYVTLTHQKEEIFIGVDKSTEVEVPSEDLIREVIRKFGLEGHAAACVIQVNIDRPAKRYEVLAESHGQSHVSYGLVLDKDGQFYESLGESSRRLFIMSENQGGEEAAQNAKINVRIEYQDGSKRNFASFCSPNTYLVEQL
jgi:hypothetical protein